MKIDATLASEIDTDERACAVLAGIVTMAEALSLDVVVEGIERQGQLDKVRDAGAARRWSRASCCTGPMPLAALLSVVRRQPPRLGRSPSTDERRHRSDAGELLAPIA